MEHLPCPTSAMGRDKLIVPYVCQEKYDSGPFMTYPRRTGSLPDLYLVGTYPGQFQYSHQTQLALLPKRELESFYQTWLFFGLIHEILGSLYVPEDFIYMCEDQDEYTTAVSTSKLMTALEEWATRIQADAVNPSVTYEHAAQCLCMLYAALSVPTARFNIDRNIRLSLVSLGETFVYAADKAFNIEYPFKNNKCPVAWCSLIDDDYWRGRFLAHGWCVSEVKFILDSTVSLQTRHFLSCLDKTNTEQNHQGCDTQQCMVYQNDLSTYQTQHVSKECDCKELSIDPKTLYSILRSKALPLIRVRQGQTLGDLSVDIVASQPRCRYVALSHVWADGLGNPYANALPRCQLSYISRIIRDLDIAAHSRDIRDPNVKGNDVEIQEEEGEEDEALLLWCDTLCCPVQPEEAKRLALEHMYQTYRDATHVLVLDSSLRQHNVEDLDNDELSMRVFTSPWMRRLWTLQEGVLPAVTDRLWFQLTHKAVNLRELLTNTRTTYFSSLGRRGLEGDIFRRLEGFGNIFLKDSPTHPRSDLRNVMEALHHRAVSVSSDEPLLIGNLLGLDADQILNGGDGAVARRMNRLWRLIPSGVHGIPNDILFRVGPRLNEPGLRWAPATMLIDRSFDLTIKPSEKEEDYAFLTPSDGLLVRLHGFRIALAQSVKGLAPPHKILEDPNCLWVSDDVGSLYQICRRLPVEQDRFLTDRTLAEVISQGNNLWVIHLHSEFPRPPASTAQSAQALIVEVETGEEAEVAGLAVKKAHAKLHIDFTNIKASSSPAFALAFTFSNRLLSNSPTFRRLAAMKHGLDEQSSSSPSPKTAALEELASEIHQLATSEEAKKAVAADGNKPAVSDIEEMTKILIRGPYVRMGEKAPKGQPWCVD